MKNKLLPIALFLAAVVNAAEQTSLPQDVQAYIEDRMNCNQLGGEDYSDPSRARAMAEELRECGYGDMAGVPTSTSTVTTVDKVEKRLRKKYRNQPKILQAMDAANDEI